jgi:predicted helicase
VFGIQVGVSINLLVRNRTDKSRKPGKPAIYYATVPANWRREEKYRFLADTESARNIEWKQIQPDDKHSWLREGLDDDFDTFMPLGTKLAKQMDVGGEGAVFKTYSLGVSTNRDNVVYDFNREALVQRVELFCDDYNAEVSRYVSKGRPQDVDAFVRTESVIWSETLKRRLVAGHTTTFDGARIRQSLFRPFCRLWLYYDPVLNDRPGAFHEYLPSHQSKQQNRLICVNLTPERPFTPIAACLTPSKDLAGGFGSPSYCFPFYTYAEDGSERRENITDWALQEFQTRYGDPKISKRDTRRRSPREH